MLVGMLDKKLAERRARGHNGLRRVFPLRIGIRTFLNFMGKIVLGEYNAFGFLEGLLYRAASRRRSRRDRRRATEKGDIKWYGKRQVLCICL